jgi:hypothetical protein
MLNRAVTLTAQQMSALHKSGFERGSHVAFTRRLARRAPKLPISEADKARLRACRSGNAPGSGHGRISSLDPRLGGLDASRRQYYLAPLAQNTLSFMSIRVHPRIPENSSQDGETHESI